MRLAPAVLGLVLVAACAEQPSPRVAAPDAPLAATTTAPIDVNAEAARLRAALAREVPGLIVDTPDRERLWIARTQATLNAAGHSIADPQLMVVVDRNPGVQQMRIMLARPSGPWQSLGGARVSTGQAARRAYYLTPTGVFLHTDAILDWRAEGTFNAQHIRGLGRRGMRVWDFGWQRAERGWGAGSESETRLLLHATDPDYLEQGLGRPASKGCIRIPAAMNRFLDRHGILDADYERAAKTDGRFAALLLPDRIPTRLRETHWSSSIQRTCWRQPPVRCAQPRRPVVQCRVEAPTGKREIAPIKSTCNVAITAAGLSCGCAENWGTAMLTPLIKKLEHFLPLPHHEKEWLNGLIIRLEEFAAHVDIIRQEDVPTGVFVVSAGHACRYKIVPDGGRQILDFMFVGDMSELHSLLLRAMDHGILTLGPTTIARLDGDRLLGEMIDRPYTSIALWWSSLQRAALLRERIAVIGRRDAHARIAHLLCEIFERLKLVGETADHRYLLPLTQVELADALGMSEVHANRMLHRLEQEQLIAVDRRTIRIPDLAALKAVAGFDAGYLHLEGAPPADRLSARYPSRDGHRA
jgi:CRP-like cAMP-binding protein